MATKRKPRSRPAQTAPPAKKLPVLWIGGAVVGLALVVAIAISLADSESTSTVAVETGSPTVSGALPALEGGSDPAVGTPIPSVSGTNFDGDIVTIGPDQGPGGVVFLAHWCSHCQAEVPAVQEWLDGGAVPAAPIFSVSTSTDPTRGNYPPWSWLEREGWTSPVVVDDAQGTVFLSFGGRGFPYWVFFDGNGNVVARTEGELPVDTLQQLLQLAAGS